MAKIAVVIHACGFESEYEICETFKIRIREAKSIAEEIGASMFIITGGVRYQKESKLLLAHYAGIYLKSLFPQNKSPYPILYAIHCYNSSTDTKNVLKICKREEVERIIIVTSEWHSEVVRQMYNYFNDNPNLTVKFAISDKGESAGIKTLFKYAFFDRLIHKARFTGLFDRLDKFLNEKQKHRMKKFQETGCN